MMKSRKMLWQTLVAGSMLVLFSLTLCAQDLPPGMTLEVRLLVPTGSRISHTGDPVEGKTIAPLYFRGEILIPQGSMLFGSVASVDRFGLGLKQTTARIDYEFHALRLPSGETIPIHTELIEVETAKERVDVDGTVHGIHPAASLSASLSLFTVPLLFIVPAVGAPVFGVKAMIAPSANPEIYFPAGTELILRLTGAIEVRSRFGKPACIMSFSADEIGQVHHLLNGSDQRARMGGHPSDFVNLLFLGSREEMDRAFHAAGWAQAAGKSPMSLYQMYHALTERIGYKRAPMNSLRLNGRSSDFVYQKSLDTVQKRHHVRLWKDPRGADVWFGAAAEDIAFRFKLAHWTHSTAPKIDNERAKVVNDLAFTGCLAAAGLVPRGSPDRLQSSEGKHLIVTDAKIAVVRLSDCNKPNTMPGIEASSSPRTRNRLLWIVSSLRNDLRLNVVFTTYNSIKLLTQRRFAKPLRKAPSMDIDRPGLDWLSTLPSRRVINSAECCGDPQLADTK